jgi:alcohol dehydrogenase class IV
MTAALLCGRGTDHTSGGMTSALGHAIGARHEMENGVANAIVLPLALRFNAGVAEEGRAKVAAALNLADADGARLGAFFEELFARLDTPRRLRDAGVPREALPGLAGLAMEDWFLRGNPRPVRAAAELEAVLEEAW